MCISAVCHILEEVPGLNEEYVKSAEASCENIKKSNPVLYYKYQVAYSQALLNTGQVGE